MSVISIKKTDNVIPIDFGEFQLDFVLNDDSIRKREVYANRYDELTNNEEILSSDKDAIPVAKKLCEDAFTDLFDKDAYSKIYEFTSGSTMTMLNILGQVLVGVLLEYNSRLKESNALNKYLK